MAGGRLVAALCLLCATVLLAIACVVAARHIAPHHDELWNHPQALALARGESLHLDGDLTLFGRHFPWVSGPYQGAFKTWLLAPLLRLFGTSPLALRAIDGGLAVLFLLALYWAARAALTPLQSAPLLLLPLLDPELLLFVPSDQGPFLLQCTLLTVALGALLRAWLRNARRWLLLGVLAASATAGDKLTAAPVVLAWGVVAVLALRGKLLGWLRSRWALWLLLVGALPAAPFAVYFACRGFGLLRTMTTATSRLSWHGKLLIDLQHMLYSGNGAEWNRMLVGVGTAPWTSYGWRHLVGPALLGGLLVLLRRRDDRSRATALHTAMALASLLLYAAFAGLTRPWHYLVLLPPLALATAHALVLLGTVRGLRWLPTVSLVAASVVGGANAWTQLSAQAEHRGALLSSPGLYGLSAELERRGIRAVSSISYSLWRPLYVLHGGRLIAEDLEGADFGSPATAGYLRQRLATANCGVVYRRSTFAWDKDWVAWLNRGAEWFERTFADEPGLDRVRIPDGRGTEFVLVVRRR